MYGKTAMYWAIIFFFDLKVMESVNIHSISVKYQCTISPSKLKSFYDTVKTIILVSSLIVAPMHW